MKSNRLYQRIVAHILDYKSIYLFVCILFLMGVIFGAILVNSLSLTQRHDLFMYLSQFFHEMKMGYIETSPGELFLHSFTHYGKYIGLMWILAISMIGLPIIFVLLFMKGVIVGFTVGFLVNQMGAQGFFLAFVSVLPQNLILVPAFIVVGTLSVSFSLRLLRQTFTKGYNEPVFPHFLRYTVMILIIGSAVTFAAVIEAYIAPVLMKWIISAF
ncbi:LOW QUALITY PROTEIN: stage II sporulation protein M [Bacillus sp. JCM 19045]|nr:LOW QUALITY PROTEIN: stage II sporulation protein M [Bacillus sp. JCM 19045]